MRAERSCFTKKHLVGTLPWALSASPVPITIPGVGGIIATAFEKYSARASLTSTQGFFSSRRLHSRAITWPKPLGIPAAPDNEDSYCWPWLCRDAVGEIR